MNSATVKWISLFSDILTWELEHSSDGNLLSEAADRFIEKHPVLGRVLIIAAGSIITAHLSNALPDRFDLMSKRGVLVGALRRVY